MTIDVSALISLDTAANVAAKGLQVAQALGLAVSTWRTGDPTKTAFAFIARILAGVDSDPNDKGLGGIIAGLARSAFLSTAEDDWLKLEADEVYGVQPVLAQPATSTVVLTNTAGGFYPALPGDITVKCTATGQTYHTVSGPLNPTTLVALPALSAGVTAAFNVVADLDGSAASAPTNGIDALVTSLLGVVVVSSTAAVGVDAQSDPEIRTQCQATLGALSPDGPPDAYEFVLRNPDLTGVSDITRAKTIADSTTGHVTCYVASASGTVAVDSITAGQLAIETWATPLCITPTVANGTPVVIDVTATITGRDVPSDFESRIALQLGVALSNFDIADADGDLVDTTLLTAVMRTEVPQIKTIALSTPATVVALAPGQFPVIGTVSITEDS